MSVLSIFQIPFFFFTNSLKFLFLLSIDSFHFPNFFFTKSSYLLRSFLARFPPLSIDSFDFPNSFLPNPSIYCDRSFFLLRIDSFDFPSSFSQSIPSIHCDFSSLYKFFFTNSYLSLLFFVRSFSFSVSIFHVSFPQSIQSIYRDFSSLVFFLSIDSPTSFSQSIQSIYYVFVPPSLFTIRKQAFNLDRHRFTAQTMLSPPRADSSLRDVSLATPDSRTGNQDSAEILLQT